MADRQLIRIRYFQTARISTLGTFQDGALKHNNPINLALWENRRIWPTVTQPDVVLSLGTGTNINEDSPSPLAASFRHVILDGFLPRIWRSYMSDKDGERTWRELWNSLDDTVRADYFRANVRLPDSLLAIDRVDHMDQLREYVHTQSHNDRFRQILPFALITSTFYFELTTLPLFQKGKLYCKGIVRCSLKGAAICQTLKRVHPSNLVFMAGNDIIGYYKADEDLCPSCTRYRKEVEFTVRHRDEPVTISMQSNLQGKRRISAFPQTMEWFQTQQRLDSHFGTPFHHFHRACRECDPERPPGYDIVPKRKGRERFPQRRSPRKRPRLR